MNSSVKKINMAHSGRETRVLYFHLLLPSFPGLCGVYTWASHGKGYPTQFKFCLDNEVCNLWDHTALHPVSTQWRGKSPKVFQYTASLTHMLTLWGIKISKDDLDQYMDTLVEHNPLLPEKKKREPQNCQ